jgi:hypothetical protein
MAGPLEYGAFLDGNKRGVQAAQDLASRLELVINIMIIERTTSLLSI